MFHKNDSYTTGGEGFYTYLSPDKRVNAGAVGLLWLEAALFSHFKEMPTLLTVVLAACGAQQLFRSYTGHSVLPLDN